MGLEEGPSIMLPNMFPPDSLRDILKQPEVSQDSSGIINPSIDQVVSASGNPYLRKPLTKILKNLQKVDRIEQFVHGLSISRSSDDIYGNGPAEAILAFSIQPEKYLEDKKQQDEYVFLVEKSYRLQAEFDKNPNIHLYLMYFDVESWISHVEGLERLHEPSDPNVLNYYFDFQSK